jgi:hypothetical protein
MARPTAVLMVVVLFASPLAARIFMTREEALATAFPRDVKVTRQAVFLKPAEIEEVRQESGIEPGGALVIRYAGSDGSYAYFDTHRVRTMPETIMITVDADQKIGRIEILSFDEPTDYYPKRRWLDQFLHRALTKDLSLSGAIRPMSGASLTGRSITGASRKILALHRVIGMRTP